MEISQTKISAWTITTFQKKKRKKSKSPYSPTKIKTRNFLSNISYRRISDKDFRNANFIIDMLSYIVMNLKPFFLTTTYSHPEQQEMVKMLWEKCLPKKFYEHVKKLGNFEILNSGKINFKQAKEIVYAYVQLPDVWQELLKYIAKNQSIYQYTYSLLFPLNYLQSNKYGIKVRNRFSLCYSEWLNNKFKKEQEQKYLAKNPFNFAVYENETRHPFEQKPIKDNFEVEMITKSQPTPSNTPVKTAMKNDDKYRADVVDSSNKENIPPYSDKTRFRYAPTMVDLKRDFDKKYKLPTVKKQRMTSKQKIDQRNKKKEELNIKLAEVEEKIIVIFLFGIVSFFVKE